MIKRFLFNITPEQTLLQEISMTALRVFIGLAFALAHGLGKLPPSEQLIGGVAKIGFPAPVIFAWAASLAEFIGGLFLAAGFLTRLSAFSIAFTMLVAGFLVHGSDPFRVKELAFVYLLASLLFFTRGAGSWSIDRFLR